LSRQTEFLNTYKGFVLVSLQPIEGEGTTPYCLLYDSEGVERTELTGYGYMGAISKIMGDTVLLSAVIQAENDLFTEVEGFKNSTTSLSMIRVSLNECVKTKLFFYDEPDTLSRSITLGRKGSIEILDVKSDWIKAAITEKRTEYTGRLRTADIDPFPYGKVCD